MLNYITNHCINRVAAVMIDVKKAIFCDPYDADEMQCSVKMIHKLVTDILGTRFNVIYELFDVS